MSSLSVRVAISLGISLFLLGSHSVILQSASAAPARNERKPVPLSAASTSESKSIAVRPIKDKWAVVIGIDKFKDPRIPVLQYPSKDASDFAKYLVKQGNFAEDHVLLLTNENATRDAIRDAVGGNWLPRRVAKDDLVVIFASTHGSPKELDVAGENFLVAWDSDPENLYVTGIRFSDLAPEIKDRTGCDRVVLLLDACNSGSAGVGGKGLIRTGNFDVSSLAGEGQVVISSSAANQRSFESKRYDNGVFTKQLIAALQAKGQKTTLSQAFDYLKEQVENEVRYDRKLEQTPVMRSKWTGGELILVAIPSQPRHVEPDTPTVATIQPGLTAPVVSADLVKNVDALVKNLKYVDARPLIQQGADQGIARCQYLLGWLYEQGQAVPQNYATAAQWFQKAADQGDFRAQYHLGKLYFDGNGVPQNLSKAAEWYQKSADNGYAKAQVELAIMYDNGNGVPQNYDKAADLYQRAADQGNECAQCQLGLMYQQGHGVPLNLPKAIEWYQKAAAHPGKEAKGGCFYLAVLYITGRGVPQSDQEAFKWYTKSAELGEPAAQNNLAFMYQDGKGAPQSYEKAAYWFQKASDLGHSLAMVNLANLYLKGLGVPRDQNRAIELLKQAAARGNAQAQSKLKELGQ